MPTAGVQRGTQGTFTYVIKSDNTVTMRTIKLGPTEGELAAVESGLAPGEQVVVDGSDKLREGAKVEPISKDTAAAPRDAARPHQGAGKRHPAGGGAAPSN
jgi:multidrug efflux system membrane fusion protein